jgi:tetratricopeptide (TPR) repeat protein
MLTLYELKRHVKLVFGLFIVFTISACASTSTQSSADLRPTEELLSDKLFPSFRHYPIETSEQIFYLDEAALAFIDKQGQGIRTEETKIRRFIKAVFERTELSMNYASDANTVASETFKRAKANCLSLSIMTYAMAKHAGLDSYFQIVDIPEYWTRRNGYSMLNGHINLRIKPRSRVGIQTLFENTFVVDFDSEISAKKFPAVPVDESVVLSMFYNNKGADALLEKELDKAYAYFRASVLNNPNHAGTWVNLGYLYRLANDYDSAEMAYQQAIAISKEQLTAWENLAILYKLQGKAKQAADIQYEIERKRKQNPFYHQMLAEVDRDYGDFDSSISHYLNAISLDRNQHQFYFGLASAYFEKGDIDNSARYLKVAKRKAGRSALAEVYGNKLSALANYVE